MFSDLHRKMLQIKQKREIKLFTQHDPHPTMIILYTEKKTRRIYSGTLLVVTSRL